MTMTADTRSTTKKKRRVTPKAHASNGDAPEGAASQPASLLPGTPGRAEKPKPCQGQRQALAATPEALHERLAAASFPAPAPGDVEAVQGAGPVEGLTVGQYVGLLLTRAHADPLSSPEAVAAVEGALGRDLTLTMQRDCKKAWRVRVEEEHARVLAGGVTGGVPVSAALMSRQERLALRSEMETLAEPVIAHGDPLDYALQTARQHFALVGMEVPFKAALLGCIAVLLERPIFLALTGESSSGKTMVGECAVAMLPPSEVISFTGGSPRALVYMQKDMRHRLLWMPDANAMLAAGDKDNPNVGANMFRSLISEQRLVYQVVQRQRAKRGEEHVTVEKIVDGPIGALCCLSTTSLDYDTTTRMATLQVEPDSAQINAVMRQMASGYQRGITPLPPLQAAQRRLDISAALAPMRAFCRYIATFGPARVSIPFAQALEHYMPKARRRAMRDMPNMLGLIQAHAVLNRYQRQVDADGCIVAQIADYAAVRDLLAVPAAAADDENLAAIRPVMPILRGVALLARSVANEEKQETPATVGDAANSEWPVGVPVKLTGRSLAAATLKASGVRVSHVTALAWLGRAERLELVERTDDNKPAPLGKAAKGVYQLTTIPPLLEGDDINPLPSADALCRMMENPLD